MQISVVPLRPSAATCRQASGREALSTGAERPDISPLAWICWRGLRSEQRSHVIVLKTVERPAVAKLDLVGSLSAEERLRLIIITDLFLPPVDRLRLSGRILQPVTCLNLIALDLAAVRDFFLRLSADHALGLSHETIDSLTAEAGGYPLRMQALARRELQRAGLLSGDPSAAQPRSPGDPG